MKAKKLLFITDTYYPDSSATTSITVRVAEALASLGYFVDAYPAEITGKYFKYPSKHNGVRIIKTIIEGKYKKGKDITSLIKKALSFDKYDCIFSVAEAFEINLLTHDAFKGKKYIWYPMSYDPFAYNPHINEKQKKEFLKLEEKALKDAKIIFFLTEFKDDYKDASFKDKIVYFNLPCIREINENKEGCPIYFDKSYINCVFLGNFYFGIENTDFIFRLFEKINLPIRLYTVGSLGDYTETVNVWKNKLKDKYICHERVTQKEAQNIMLNSDVLVSMGHDSANMCPSKVIDFIASGKPILHIEKIKNCCGSKYLKNYENKICIYQNDKLTDTKIKPIEKFIEDSKNKERIPFDLILKKYSDFTMESLIKKITNEIEKE